jgi:hypothetical protein
LLNRYDLWRNRADNRLRQLLLYCKDIFQYAVAMLNRALKFTHCDFEIG